MPLCWPRAPPFSPLHAGLYYGFFDESNGITDPPCVCPFAEVLALATRQKLLFSVLSAMQVRRPALRAPRRAPPPRAPAPSHYPAPVARSFATTTTPRCETPAGKPAEPLRCSAA